MCGTTANAVQLLRELLFLLQATVHTWDPSGGLVNGLAKQQVERLLGRFEHLASYTCLVTTNGSWHEHAAVVTWWSPTI